jgi:hypothetical protein
MSDKYGVMDAVRDLITGELKLADDDTIIARTQICDGCEVQNKPVKICTACGCFLPMKVRLTQSRCPMELW